MNSSLASLIRLTSSKDALNRGFAIDVGAHCGEFSKFLIQMNAFESVLAFEPNLESFEVIKNKVITTPTCEFDVVNIALSSKSGVTDLFCDNDSATASLLRYGQSYTSNGVIAKQSVVVASLDEYLENNPKQGRLSLFKIDTQGNDLFVIEGSKKTISMHRPIIQTEFIYTPLYEGQCSPAELSASLSELNYVMYSLSNLHVTSEGRLAFCDCIFVPAEFSLPVTQKYTCIDDLESFQTQISTLAAICDERLKTIEVLDAEIRRLAHSDWKMNLLESVTKRLKLWAR